MIPKDTKTPLVLAEFSAKVAMENIYSCGNVSVL